MSEFARLLEGLPSARRVFAPGAYLFHRGDPVRVLHLVSEGEVHLLRRQENGAAVILQRAPAGAVLAEASVFADSYHCDAVAARHSATLALDRAVVRAALEQGRGLANAFAAHLAGEVQSARLRTEILALKTVAERVDAWAAAHDGLPGKGAWKSLAEEIGTSPEALYRELAKRRSGQRPGGKPQRS